MNGHLTPRQHQVLALLALGWTNERIAEAMDIGSETVKTHVKGLFKHLEVGTRAEAVAVAFREGLLPPLR